MTDRRLTDAQVASGLRAHLPATAMPGLHGRIRAELAQVPQRSTLPRIVAGLGDADPVARRTALVAAAALLLAAVLAAAVAAGAWRLLEDRHRALSLDPPGDVPAFVLSVYDRLPRLGPVAITTLEDGLRPGRIFVAADGSVRFEHYANRGSAEPDRLRVVSGSAIWELVALESGPAGANTGGIAEDPRVFILAELGPVRSGSDLAPGCELSRDGVSGTPAARWVYVDSTSIVGRSAHHVRCDGDLWIDVQTGLPLRAVAADGSHSIEVTQLTFGPQPSELFSTDPPPGVALVPPEVAACAQDPTCLATPRPIVTPPPAPDPSAGAVDIDALIASTFDTYTHLPAFDVVVSHTNTKSTLPGSWRVVFDGTSRWRIEDLPVAGGPRPQIKLFGDHYLYRRETREDGTTVWIDGSARPDAPRGFPLWSPNPSCTEGWQQRGLDLVAGRVADHIACPLAADWTDFWIDRDSGLVLRLHAKASADGGIDVYEVLELRLGSSPSAVFDLPPDAVVVPAVGQSPTPAPLATSAPQVS